jgi:pyruvate-formate lyase-activating enzyme
MEPWRSFCLIRIWCFSTSKKLIHEIDSPKHKTLTGQSNTRVFESLLFIRDTMDAHGRPGQLWIRTPIIPGATAREDNIQGIGEYIAEHVGPVVDRWELCAFNNLCQDKYQRLGLEWEFAGSELMLVHWSGSTRIEDHTGALKPQ